MSAKVPSFLVPYSCGGRCFCPSCHQKRALEKAGWVAEHVCAEVPHRQFVFTIPKRLRIYFRFDRRLLGQLSTGRALEASTDTFRANGAKIQTWKLYRGLNQLWEVRRAATGAFYLLSVGGNRALDTHDADVDRNGGRVQLYDFYPDNRNQQWILQPLGAGRYAIRCAASQGNKVIQIKGNVIDRSGEAELADLFGTPGQIWTFTPASDRAIVEANLVDLRPNQTPIKAQGNRGSCTYFGATAALEAAYKKAGHGDVDLSEEFWAMMGKALYVHPIWSDNTHANYRENQFAGTQGGGSLRCTIRFGWPSGSSVAGLMSLTGGGTLNVQANLLGVGQLAFSVEGGAAIATARFLNHEPGLLCGSTHDGRAFYAAYVARR